MLISIYWDNPTRSLIDRAEFGKGMSFKRKLGFKSATLRRQIEVTLPNVINMTWKRRLQSAINSQFQMNKQAVVYVTNADISQSRFVVSARNALEFSNKVANGILILRKKHKNHIDKITIKDLISLPATG